MPATIQLSLQPFAAMDGPGMSGALQAADHQNLAARAAVRERQLLGRAFRRYTLAAALAVNPADLTLTYNARGKPLLSSHPLHFSCSHSHSAYALAWSAEIGPLGVDTEDESRTTHMEQIARRNFSAQERRALARSRDPMLTWLTIWTRKEAALKCSGIGMRIPLESVATGAPSAAATVVNGPCGQLRLHSWRRHGQLLSLAYPARYTARILFDEEERLRPQ